MARNLGLIWIVGSALFWIHSAMRAVPTPLLRLLLYHQPSETMLNLIDPDAISRFGWLGTYQDRPLEAHTLPNPDKQLIVISSYFETLKNISGVQAKLVAAYKTSKNESTTNIGVKLASGRNHSDFTSRDYKQYLSLNASYTKLLIQYDKLETTNKVLALLVYRLRRPNQFLQIAPQGNMLQKILPTAPAIFNLSMITAGDSSSPSFVKFSGAWGELNDGFHNTTYNNTTMASSINGDAPVPTPSANQTSPFSPPSVTPTPISRTTSQSRNPNATSLTATARTTVSAQRSRLVRASRVPALSRLDRCAGTGASSALLLAASSTSSGSFNSASADHDSPVEVAAESFGTWTVNLGSKKQVASLRHKP
ncbi:hypothetical protein D9757_010175 [Collybiopsis confluens]|uniref:Uncharacterized protein n=1 Tax=Collybiopsis confluens TaxID=2823264 RepID=A0A8H5H0Q7_9AGAR|nr:hypothetical protein D9757_010175 [Collybiopsis confluens]